MATLKGVAILFCTCASGKNRPMKNVAIFVDVQNIYYTTRDQFGKSFDYRKFWQSLLLEPVNIQHAFAYAIQSAHSQQQKFQKALEYIGFEVKRKPFIERLDGSAKGDWDVGITIDMLEYSPTVDEVILLSGDGDFSILLAHIKSKYNCKTRVVSAESLTAVSLINAADTYQSIQASQLI